MPNVLGLDIGGTKISGVVWDGRRAVKELTAVTPSSLPGFKTSLLKLVDALSPQAGLRAIGAGAAGRIDPDAGMVKHSPNIPYLRGFPLKEWLRQRCPIVKIDNDAAAFLLAETELGKAKKYREVFGLVVGTGVGGAMLLGGYPYRGWGNMGGEIGAMEVGGGLTLEQAYQKYKLSNDYAAMTEAFARAFVVVIELLAPQAVAIGGTYGRINAQKFLVPALGVAAKKLSKSACLPKLLVSELPHAGAIGAALLASRPGIDAAGKRKKQPNKLKL